MSLAAALASAYGASPRGWAGFLSRADFIADLLYTAVPQRAASGTTATFTRATTSTWKNNDGYLVTGVAGEIGFVGARRIYNLWTTSSVSLANGANKSLTLSAGTYAFSMGAGTGTATFSGTGGATGTLAASASGRVSVNKTISAGTFVVTASVADLADLQVESLTAQTTQTAGEYVSVGVESAPYYHGSFVDGVKCFPTDLAGNPLTTMLGYLAEGARTNLVVRSNELDNASWGKNNATVSANTAVASDGTTSLDKIVEDATTSTHTVYQTFAGTSGSYTVAVEMKQAERTWGFITEGNSVTATAFFDLANGVVGTVTGTGSPSATITALANGAYRCTMTFTAGANANCQFGPAAGDGAAAYAGDITKGIYAGMAGFENASFASSYIATTTVAVTRNADVLIYSSAGNIDGTKGWCYAEFDVSNDSDGNQNIILGSDVAGVFPLYAQPSLGNVRTLDGTNAPIAQSAPMTGVRKGAGTWGGSTMQSAHNGVVSSTTAFDGNMEVTAVIRIGEDNAGNSHFFGTIKNLRIGQRQLSASELQAITS